MHPFVYLEAIGWLKALFQLEVVPPPAIPLYQYAHTRAHYSLLQWDSQCIHPPITPGQSDERPHWEFGLERCAYARIWY